jgi:hypothetical protein
MKVLETQVETNPNVYFNAHASISAEDISIIEMQLKRHPAGVAAVVSRCVFGCPQVIRNEVFVEEKPFPTLFWLTCPLKVKAVSRIEGQGWSDHVKKRIKTDSELKERLLQAHDDYRRCRKETVAGTAYAGHAILNTGIGGVHDIEGIKCLHAHYAHYLATGENPLGEMLDKLLLDIKCERRCDAR